MKIEYFNGLFVFANSPFWFNGHWLLYLSENGHILCFGRLLCILRNWKNWVQS